MREKKLKKKLKKSHLTASMFSASIVCPSCFEEVDTFPDPGAGTHQSYVEDCPVCCRPNVLHVAWDADAEVLVVSAERE